MDSSADALTLEADALQRLLLGDVVDLSAGLKPVRRRGAEEMVDELPLRFGPDAVTAVLWEEDDADLVDGPPTDSTPVHNAGTRAVVEHYREVRGGLLADQTVLAPAAFQIACLVHSEPEPLELAGGVGIPVEPGEEFKV